MGKKKNRRRNYHSKMWRGGTMKSMPFIILGFVLIFGFYGISTYVNANKQTWAMQAQIEQYQKQRLFEEQLKKEQADAEWWARNGWLVTGTFYSLILVVPAAAGYAMWHLRNRRIENSLRAKEGLFPLQVKLIDGNQQIINPNILTDGVTQLGNQQKALPAPAQYQLQSQALVNQGKAQIAQAVSNQPIKYAAQGKLLAGAYDRVVKPAEFHVVEDEVPMLPQLEMKEVPFDEAVKQSSKFIWNVGQYADSEDLAKFNFKQQSHVLICGGTNCGKTSSTGYLLALYALKAKMHVLICDGAGGADWDIFKSYVEFYEGQPEDLEKIISNIETIYTERQEILKAEGIADNYQSSQPIQPIVVIIDELGYLLDGLNATDKKLYKNVVARFRKMIRVIRKVSIHLVVIDQNASSIPQEIITNIKCVFAYNAEGHVGAAIKRYNLDKLKPQGQFDYYGKPTNAWYTKQFVQDYLYKVKPNTQILFNMGDNFTDNIDNDNGGVETQIIDVKPTPQLLIDKTDNTPISPDKKVVKLKGEPITAEEKQYVYQTYLDNDRKTNQTCKAIWGNAGGYTKYLKKVVEEYEA